MTEYHQYAHILTSSQKIRELAEVGIAIQQARTRAFGSAVTKAVLGGSIAFNQPFTPLPLKNIPRRESIFAWTGLPHVLRIRKAIMRPGTPIDPLSIELPEHKQNPNQAGEIPLQLSLADGLGRISLSTLALPTPKMTHGFLPRDTYPDQAPRTGRIDKILAEISFSAT